MEWLWNPQIVGIYNRLLQRCELNKHTTEAASGALQNITAGDRRVRGRPWPWPVLRDVPTAWAGTAVPGGLVPTCPRRGTWPLCCSPPGQSHRMS